MPGEKNKGGNKYDGKKPRWDLLPLDLVEEIVRVVEYGANKYAPNDWKLVRPKERFFAAALRHMTKYQAGEIYDQESGLPHLSHAITSLLFLFWLDLNLKEEHV